MGEVGEAASAAAAERERLADRLHDEVLPVAAALAQDIGELDESVASQLRGQAAGLIDALRDVIRSEHPLLGVEIDLTEAVRAAAGPACRRGGLTLYVDVDANAQPCWRRRQAALECVRELATNAARHAQANELRVHVVEDVQATVVSVADDGIGLDRAAMDDRQRQGHLGLARLRRRVEVLGGAALIETPHYGTAVTIVLPIQPRF